MIDDWLERLTSCGETSALHGAFFEAMAHYGFTNVFYSARFLVPLPSSLTQGHAVTVTNLPPDIARQFTDSGVISQSLWADWVFNNSGEISSRDLLAAAASGAPTQMLRIARRLDLTAAQILSLRDRELRSHGALLLNPHVGAAHEDVARLWSSGGRQVRVLARVFHLRMATMRRDTRKVLTPRQREVLEWRSAGKTIAEIATILGVTPATVEKHMRLAREALGAETTAQAILKAHVAQELFPDHDRQNPFT